MDINKAIADMKKEPGFVDNVGMILVHNGVVRGWSRGEHKTVTSVHVTPDLAKMEKIRDELQQRDGIYRIIVHSNSGELKPGDDLLYLVVAGDIRENVKEVFAELLDRIKSESVVKVEHTK